MGLFDKMLGGQSADRSALSPQEAFCGVLLMAIAADGHISDEEKENFVGVSNRMRLLKSQTASQFNAMVDKLFLLMNKLGPEAFLAKAAQILQPELRETAFAVAVDLVFADGIVEDEEMAIVEAIQTAMQLDDHLALKIVEVRQIKNRG